MIIRQSLCTPSTCEAKLGSAAQCCFREHLESFWGASPEHCPGFGFKQKVSLLAYFHICAHYFLKGKPHTILPPVDRVGEPNLEKWSTVTSRARVPGYSHQWPWVLFSFPLSHWVWTQRPETMPMKLSHSVVSKRLKHLWAGTIEMMDCYGLPS